MEHRTPFGRALRDAMEDLPTALPEGALEKLEGHWELVVEWGKRHNLTAIDDGHRAARHHYRDSLEALPFITGSSLIDIGSGAGFPGVPIAIARPELSVCLLEPRRKRASFLRVAAARLELGNVSVKAGRIGDTPGSRFECATTRATFSRQEQAKQCLSWLTPDTGRLILFRSDGRRMGPDSTEIHRYTIATETRVLEIWRTE